MKVASIQMSVVEGDKTATIDKAVENIHRCEGFDLVILPEIWNVGFMSFDRYITEAEDSNGQTLTRLREAAQKIGVYLHSGSFVEKKNGNYYNSSYLISPDGDILANYLKIHLFGYQSDETQLLTPGRDIVVADMPWGPSGLSTCYDLRFPELFRRMTDRGAIFFLVTSAWPMARLAAWRLFNQARAHENLAYLISCNCAGVNGGTQLAGHSMVVDPWGKIVAEGGDGEDIVVAEIDPELPGQVRSEFPALADRTLS